MEQPTGVSKENEKKKQQNPNQDVNDGCACRSSCHGCDGYGCCCSGCGYGFCCACDEGKCECECECDDD